MSVLLVLRRSTPQGTKMRCSDRYEMPGYIHLLPISLWLSSLRIWLLVVSPGSSDCLLQQSWSHDRCRLLYINFSFQWTSWTRLKTLLLLGRPLAVNAQLWSSDIWRGRHMSLKSFDDLWLTRLHEGCFYVPLKKWVEYCNDPVAVEPDIYDPLRRLRFVVYLQPVVDHFGQWVGVISIISSLAGCFVLPPRILLRILIAHTCRPQSRHSNVRRITWDMLLLSPISRNLSSDSPGWIDSKHPRNIQPLFVDSFLIATVVHSTTKDVSVIHSTWCLCKRSLLDFHLTWCWGHIQASLLISWILAASSVIFFFCRFFLYPCQHNCRITPAISICFLQLQSENYLHYFG